MNPDAKKNPRFSRVIIDDFKQEKKFRTIRSEFRDYKNFYINEKQRIKAARMGKMRRFFYFSYLLLKELFLKLSPIRRVILLIGLFLSLSSFTINNQSSGNSSSIGPLLILFVLGLELKDKLIAKEELSAGKAVQIALLPDLSPDLKGWDVWLHSEPAREVGGDLIDFIQTGEKKYRSVIGDVSGKGLAAALYMVKLQSSIRVLTPECGSLEELFKKTNNFFASEGESNKFASLICLDLEENSNQVEYINAGHIPPIKKSTAGISKTIKGDVAIGLKTDSAYSSHTITMNPNDYLIIVSDGVTEVMNEQGEFFGEERLESFISEIDLADSAAVGDALLSSIRKFKGGQNLFDDVSIIILKKI